ncbi:hypothetical protein [Ralstonia syzygii]|uniref:Uncharacterized protein n=1 Tax=Ralstonia syzygii R24 TaxID=907261 RepID=G3A9Q3_9RALS|nr:hypothetical protein [Ralstonia syzygii]CCA88019.1 conserved exported hypothetical protein [Ralstonia syzygii R24]
MIATPIAVTQVPLEKRLSPATRPRRRIAPAWPRLVAALAGFVFMLLPVAHAQAREPNGIDYSMYYLADVHDNEHCKMEVDKNGKWSVDQRISNPAMTCPDMTSWRLFATVVRDKFWSDWADEEQNWPQEPWPLCSSKTDTNCCAPHSSKNDPQHCPIFPRDARDRSPELLKAVAPALRIGRPALTQHLQELASPVALDKMMAEFKASRSLRALASETPECEASMVDKLVPKTYESIGRVIRQTNSEITIRNRAFHDYLFENNLYNSNGIAAVFAANDENQQKNAPYAVDSRSASQGQPAKLGKIDFPPDAIMIKSNWLYEGIAKKLGIANTSEKPFITQKMITQVTDQNRKPICKLTGVHYLMAFHISSKDIPNWVWTTFEHIAMPGRCDFIGCNDSYGYASTDPLPSGVARNYIAPRVKSDGLIMSPAFVFDHDQPYPTEKIRSGLDQVFKKLGIGTAASTNSDQPSISDLGWRSYRLKGSQVDFTNAMGRKTVLGNSITEAGFMNNSSCITCHARAGIHVESNEADFLRLSIFNKDQSDYGYALSYHGIPNPSWFHNDNGHGTLDVLQVDFVWGFFNASPVVAPTPGNAGQRAP